MIDLGEDPLKLDRQVCFALAVASRSVIAIYRPLLEPYGLTHPQYLVMLALWERSPRSVKDLGTTLRHEPATLSPLLKRLEALGYVTRTRSRADGRHARPEPVGRASADRRVDGGRPRAAGGGREDPVPRRRNAGHGRVRADGA